MSIRKLLAKEATGQEVELNGWIRTFRSNRFLSINDGSTLSSIQAVVDFENTDEDILRKLNTGAAVNIKGKLVPSQGKGQAVEIVVSQIDVLGEADPDQYPLQPKRHSLEFLREKAHLRFRTNTFSAVFRLRHAMTFAIHKYFNDREFFNLHTPIITGSDAEGAGEMFHVTNFDLDNIPKTKNSEVNFDEDFFGKETNLTVSGQLEAELAALALSKVYTFGPTFRAENSNTSRHLAEFWMVEPEVAFYDLNDNMDLTEDFLKYLCRYALENNKEDVEFLNQREIQENKAKPQDQRPELNLLERLEFVINNDFERINYTAAIDILRQSKPYKKKEV